jgi:hypothetical protein
LLEDVTPVLFESHARLSVPVMLVAGTDERLKKNRRKKNHLLFGLQIEKVSALIIWQEKNLRIYTYTISKRKEKR